MKFWKGRWPQWPERFLRGMRDPKANQHSVRGYWDTMFENYREELTPMLAQDRCSACKGVWHPATGHRHSDKTVVCGPCARHFFGWVKTHTNRRWGSSRFYDHATRPSKK
jgi:hypothetical protein